MERRDDFWLPQLCCSCAMRAKAKRLPRQSGIVWTMARTRRKQKEESISPLMNVIRLTVADSSFWQASYAAMTGREQKKKMMCCAIRYDNPSIRARSPRRSEPYRTELAMRWTRGGTLLSLPRTPIKQHIHWVTFITSTLVRKFLTNTKLWGSSFALRRLSDRRAVP